MVAASYAKRILSDESKEKNDPGEFKTNGRLKPELISIYFQRFNFTGRFGVMQSAGPVCMTSK